MRVNKLVPVCLFSEMKVGRDRVLKKMDDQIAEQNKKRRTSALQFETLGNHLNQSGSQHESRAESHKVAKITSLPVPLHNDRPAENIGSSGSQAQENTGKDGVHWNRDDISSQFSVLSQDACGAAARCTVSGNQQNE